MAEHATSTGAPGAHRSHSRREPFPYVIDPNHHQPLRPSLPPELWQLYENGFQTFDAEPGRHILGGHLAINDFDPNGWIERLAEAGGGVGFGMELSMSPNGDVEAALPIWLELRDPADGEARRASIFRAMVLREAVTILRGGEAHGVRSMGAGS